MMPVKIDGEVHFWTLEVCRKANISRPTILRRLEEGVLTKIRRDRMFGIFIMAVAGALFSLSQGGNLTLP